MNPLLDRVFDAATTWGYVWIVTKDNEGFWAYTTDQIYYKTNVLAELQKNVLDLILKYQAGDEKSVNKIVQKLRMHTFKHLEEFVPDSRIIPFLNGIYYIDAHQFFPNHWPEIPPEEELDIEEFYLGHSRLEYNHKTFSLIPHNYNIEAPFVQEWDDFVDFVFDNDQDAIQTFYEYIGYCLTTIINKKKFLLIIGPKDSGKTTLSRVALHAIGTDNYSIVKFSAICSKDTFVRYGIIDKRVNYDDDIGKSRIDAIDEIKDLTGGLTEIWVNPKHEKPYKHYHITRFWCLCNKIPLIKDLDIPIAGRFLLLRVRHTFSNVTNCAYCGKLHPIDSSFECRMKTEPVAEHIINRALLALNDLLARQAFLSQSDEEILDVLRLELEPVYAFINKLCATGISNEQCTPQPELYERFVEFLDDEGIKCYIDTQRKFTEQLANYGHKTIQVQQSGWNAATGNYNKNVHRKIYKGLALKDKIFISAKPAEPIEEEGQREIINL